MIGGYLVSLLLGLALASLRYAKNGYPEEPKRPALQLANDWLREVFYIERGAQILLVRPIRWLSQEALARGIEKQLIDRVVVTGGSGLIRQAVWSLLRRLQNGRLQSYTLIGLLTALVIVTWMVTWMVG